LLSARIRTVPGAPFSRATTLALEPGAFSAPASFSHALQAATGSAGGSCACGGFGTTGLVPIVFPIVGAAVGVAGAGVGRAGVAGSGVGVTCGESVGTTGVCATGVAGPPPATAESLDD
jgi:hypothetical protein